MNCSHHVGQSSRPMCSESGRAFVFHVEGLDDFQSIDVSVGRSTTSRRLSPQRLPLLPTLPPASARLRSPDMQSRACSVGSRPSRAMVCKDGRTGPTRPAPPPWLSLAETVSVGSKDEHAVALVVVPEVASSDANISPPVPERGQRRRDRREPPSARACRVLNKDERRSESADDSDVLPPQAGAGADGHAGATASDADVLARGTANEQVAPKSSAGACASCEPHDVAVKRHIWPVLA